MSSSPHLALAYIAMSPESAGRVLAALPTEATAAFIEDIPLSYAVKLIAHLKPAAAANIVLAIDRSVADDIFGELDVNKASAIVRQMDRDSRNRFLLRLSARTRTMLEKSTRFSPGTVGAHMTSKIETLRATDSVATALDTISRSDIDHTDLVFVLNEEGRLMGVVSSAIALRHPQRELLSAVLDANCAKVSPHTRLEAIADPGLWQDFAYLPVVDSQHQVIGAIGRKALRAGLDADDVAEDLNSQSISASTLEVFATTLTGLFNLVFVRSPRTASGEDRNER